MNHQEEVGVVRGHPRSGSPGPGSEKTVSHMKIWITTTFTVAAVAVGGTLAQAGPANALETGANSTAPSTSSASVAVSTIAAALPKAIQEGSASLDSAGRYVSKHGTLRVGSAGTTTLSGPKRGETMKLTLPGSGNREFALADGTAVTDHGAYVVGQTPMAADYGGGVVVTFTMKDATSQSSFPVRVKVPGGAKLKPMKGGAVLIMNKQGRKVGMLPKPWAKDANGQDVPTRYVVAGGTVTQQVFPNSGTAYPVVADPWFIPAWAVAQIIRCGFGGALGYIASAGWNWWWRAVAVVGGCLTGAR